MLVAFFAVLSLVLLINIKKKKQKIEQGSAVFVAYLVERKFLVRDLITVLDDWVNEVNFQLSINKHGCKNFMLALSTLLFFCFVFFSQF